MGTCTFTAFTPSRTSNGLSASRGRELRKSVGYQMRETPQRTFCRPMVKYTLRAMSKRSQSWSRNTDGFARVAGVSPTNVPPAVLVVVVLAPSPAG